MKNRSASPGETVDKPPLQNVEYPREAFRPRPTREERQVERIQKGCKAILATNIATTFVLLSILLVGCLVAFTSAEGVAILGILITAHLLCLVQALWAILLADEPLNASWASTIASATVALIPGGPVIILASLQVRLRRFFEDQNIGVSFAPHREDIERVTERLLRESNERKLS